MTVASNYHRLIFTAKLWYNFIHVTIVYLFSLQKFYLMYLYDANGKVNSTKCAFFLWSQVILFFINLFFRWPSSKKLMSTFAWQLIFFCHEGIWYQQLASTSSTCSPKKTGNSSKSEVDREIFRNPHKALNQKFFTLILILKDKKVSIDSWGRWAHNK